MKSIAAQTLAACLLLAAPFLVTSCASEDLPPDNPVLGCDRPNRHTCIDFGSAFTQGEAADECDGKVLQGPCTTNNSVGSCQRDIAGFSLTEYFYNTAWSAKTAAEKCAEEGGVFK
jgi:hypothetical protein